MVRRIGEQLRPLLIGWLLLTLPVVCHHETVATIVGAIAGRSTLASRAAGTGDHAHLSSALAGDLTRGETDRLAALAATEPTADGAAPLRAGAPGDRLMWCAHHAATGVSVLPEGLGNVVVASCALVKMGQPRQGTQPAHLLVPVGDQPTPPVPPPRRAAA